MASRCVGVVLKPYYRLDPPVHVTLVTHEKALSTPQTPSMHPVLHPQMQYILVNTVFDGPFPQVSPHFPPNR